MAKHNAPYRYVVVESYEPSVTSGLHGSIHIRPIANQGYPSGIRVECSKVLSSPKYPLGTRFKILRQADRP